MTESVGAAQATSPPVKDVVTVSVPASSVYLAVLRTATAGLAARLDFTLDEIEDLRIAVDEACAMLLVQAVPGVDLRCEFTLEQAALQAAVSVLTGDGQEPAQDTFAWTVLTALSDEVTSATDSENRVTITLTKRRGHTG